MKAIKVKLKNFRSFGPEETTIELEEGLTGIIGANSTGKTAMLEAFRKVFGSNNTERIVLKSDFHVLGDSKPEDLTESDLSIEFFFTFDTETTEEGNIDFSIPSFFEHMVVDEPDGDPYLRIRLQSKWEKDPRNSEGIIETQLVFITCGEGEAEDETNVHNFPGHKRSLIQSYYVPAIRRPSEQIRFASGTVLHRLFKRIEWPEDFEGDFKERLDSVNELFQEVDHFGKIQTKLSGLWSEYNKDTRYNSATIAFGSTDFESILRKLEIEFAPTDTDRPFRISELGEGYRSLFYLTLVSTLLKIEEELELEEGEKPFLTLLLIEEPENHIAPQLLGRVLRNLRELSQQSNVQVIVSSHTPAIVRRIEPKAIRHLRMNEERHQTIVNTILLPPETDEAHKFVKEAVRNYPELYFSKLVVLGEGDSEEIIFRMLSRVYDKDFDDHFISVVPLGGRYVNHIWKLLHQLDIPFVTLLDLDRERGGGGWGRIKYSLKQVATIKPHEKGALLAIKGDKVMSDENLEDMHKWPVSNLGNMDAWIARLEQYDVFMSAPLDLDFLMLEAFTDEYKGTAILGPQIPDKEGKVEEFKSKLDNSIQATLKSINAKGVTYSDEQKELMIWYNYLFLGRGKPSTHILAMTSLTDEKLKAQMPPVLKRMFARIVDKIS